MRPITCHLSATTYLSKKQENKNSGAWMAGARSICPFLPAARPRCQNRGRVHVNRKRKSSKKERQ